PHFNLHAFAEDIDDFVHAMFISVLFEHSADGFRLDCVQNLSLGHLLAAHHIQLQFSQRGGVEVSEIADTRHGRAFLQTYTPLPGAGDHGTVVSDAEASTHAGLVIDVF